MLLQVQVVELEMVELEHKIIYVEITITGLVVEVVLLLIHKVVMHTLETVE